MDSIFSQGTLPYPVLNGHISDVEVLLIMGANMNQKDENVWFCGMVGLHNVALYLKAILGRLRIDILELLTV